MIYRILPILLCLSATLLADFTPGQWNAKPWQKKELFEKVQAQDPQALAEWAYCSYNTLQGIRYQPDLIIKRAQFAADKNVTLGKFTLAQCYLVGHCVKLDKDKALQLIAEIEETKHPLGTYLKFKAAPNTTPYQGVLDRRLAGNLPGAEQQVVLSQFAVTAIYNFARGKAFDRTKGIKMAHELLHKTNFVRFALLIQDHLPYYARTYGDNQVQQVRTRIIDAAALGNPHCLYFLARQELVKKNYSKATQYAIQSANLGHQDSYMLLIFCLTEANQNEIVAGNTNLGKIAEQAYIRGSRHNLIKKQYAHKIRYSKPNLKNLELATKLYLDVLHSGDCNMHRSLAYLLNQTQMRGISAPNTPPLAPAHLIYHANHDQIGVAYLATILMDSKMPDTYDPVKAFAIAKTCLPMMQKQKNSYEIRSLTKIKKQLEPKLTPEQLKEAEQLTKQNYPFAENFRLEAFQKLKKFNHIPDSWSFNSNQKHSIK